MKRPSFQFYPADWKSNAKLRRCSEAARGAWMDILCTLHDSEEYGVCRWPLEDLARAAGIAMKLARELADKDVLKGADKGYGGFQHTPTHAGKDGEPITLIEPSTMPVWFSSRMVTDEWHRSVKGASARFTAEKQPSRSPDQSPNRTPSRTPSRRQGDGSSSSTSSSTAEEELPQKRARHFATSIPDEFPGGHEYAYAKDFWAKKGRDDLSADMDDHFRDFRDHHISHGTTSKDWEASWRTWCSKALKFNRKQTNGAASRNGHAAKPSSHENFWEGARRAVSELAAKREGHGDCGDAEQVGDPLLAPELHARSG
jgi:hypothetical protein